MFATGVNPDSRRIAVVGSLNIDTFLPVERNPLPGESVLSGPVSRRAGGKGANQAVGCARLGHQVSMVGCLGGDPEGRWLRDRVLAEGVDLSAVATVAEAPTGAAFILVAQGESTIVISAGANGLLEASYVEAQPVIANADALLCQLEVPLGAVQAAVRAARGLVVLNPAPAQLLPRAILDDVDVLVPNRHELAAITGSEPTADLAGIIDCARSIKVRKAVVVTLGDQGALAVWEGNAVRIPAVPSVVVDATAAGDSFCAGLVDGLLRGMQLLQAAEWASSVAAITVSRHGAIDSLPFRHEVVALTAGDAP